MAKYLLKVPSQTDQAIYDCFVSLVRIRPERLVSQTMHIAGDLELRPGFDAPEVSRAVRRVLEGAVKAIQRVSILFDGLKVEYRRGEADAGSLYDKVYFSIESPTTLSLDELTEVIVGLAKELGAVEVQRIRDALRVGPEFGDSSGRCN